MKPAQSTIHPSCLQEFLDSAENAADLGQRQYFTPPDLAAALGSILPTSDTVFDPSIGDGSLTLAAAKAAQTYGLDIDPRSKSACSKLPAPHIATADLTKWYPIAKETSITFPTIVTNPPFSLKWDTARLTPLADSHITEVANTFSETRSTSSTIDSTLASILITLDLLKEYGNALIIANASTIDRLLPATHPILRHCWLRVDIEAEVFQNIAQWHNHLRGQKNLPTTTALYLSRTHYKYTSPLQKTPHPTITLNTADPHHIRTELRQFKQNNPHLPRGPHIHHHATPEETNKWDAVTQEYAVRHQKATPTHNITLDHRGRIRTHLTPFDTYSGRYTRELVSRLNSLDGTPPASLVVQATTRTALREAVEGNIWRVHPDVPAAVNAAIAAYESERAPFFQPNPVMALGWVDENATITCHRKGLHGVTPGTSYQLRTWLEETDWEGEIINLAGKKEHVRYRGKELCICITLPDQTQHHFHVRRDNKLPDKETTPSHTTHHHTIETFLDHFHIPIPQDITQSDPLKHQQITQHLTAIEAQINTHLQTA